MRFRLVFAGPVGAGSTTAVRALRDGEPGDREKPGDMDEPGDGAQTAATAGVDSGTWNPTDEISVSLIDLTGRSRATRARRASSTSDTCIALWLRADQEHIADAAEEWLPQFARSLDRLVIAVTHCTDDDDTGVLKALDHILVRYRIPPSRVLVADASDRDSVMRVACTALDLR